LVPSSAERIALLSWAYVSISMMKKNYKQMNKDKKNRGRGSTGIGASIFLVAQEKLHKVTKIPTYKPYSIKDSK
jgi:hypothetical protein